MPLIEALKAALADTFTVYLKAHNYHWNVTGPDFSQYHSFLDGYYNELWGAVDSIAEHIRALDAYAPGSMARFKELTTIEEAMNIPSALGMMADLASDNRKIMNTLKIAFDAAIQSDMQGVANFLADRIDIHAKHQWMLNSITRVA